MTPCIIDALTEMERMSGQRLNLDAQDQENNRGQQYRPTYSTHTSPLVFYE